MPNSGDQVYEYIHLVVVDLDGRKHKMHSLQHTIHPSFINSFRFSYYWRLQSSQQCSVDFRRLLLHHLHSYLKLLNHHTLFNDLHHNIQYLTLLIHRVVRSMIRSSRATTWPAERAQIMMQYSMIASDCVQDGAFFAAPEPAPGLAG